MAHDLLFTNETAWYAQDLRAIFDLFGEGVLDPGALLVTDGAVGLSVDVAAGSALIASDEAGDQGKYRVNVDVPQNSGAFVGGGIDPADVANPRVDRIVAHVYDDEVDGSGLTAFRLEVVTGVPTAGATLVNNNGIAAMPDNALLLARVLIEVGDVAVNPANIADDRVVAALVDPEPWHEVGAGGEPAFQNGWVNVAGYETVAFYRDPFGVVHLKGSADTGAAVLIFTLPVGYRPGGDAVFASNSLGGGGYTSGGVTIRANGDVELTQTDATLASLDGISFRAA